MAGRARRIVALSGVVLVLAAVLALVSASTAGAAPAQTGACEADGDYPATPARTDLSATLRIVSARFTPGGTGSLGLVGADPGAPYDGFVYAPPVALPLTTAAADGSLDFDGFAVPADFALGATHTLELCNGGAMVLSTSFCLAADGTLRSTACGDVVSTAGGPDPVGDVGGVSGGTGSVAGALAFTGFDHLSTMLRLAAVLLTVGVTLRYWQRRRLADAA